MAIRAAKNGNGMIVIFVSNNSRPAIKKPQLMPARNYIVPEDLVEELFFEGTYEVYYVPDLCSFGHFFLEARHVVASFGDFVK